MRTIRKPKTQAQLRKRRQLRVRRKVQGTPERPRLVIFRSLKHIYAHLVDDTQGRVIMGLADSSEGVARAEGAKGKVGKGYAVGQALAAKAKEAGISKVVFDRAGYAYHGRVKAVAEGARKGGLEF